MGSNLDYPKMLNFFSGRKNNTDPIEEESDGLIQEEKKISPSDKLRGGSVNDNSWS